MCEALTWRSAFANRCPLDVVGVGAQRFGMRFNQSTHEELLGGLATVGIRRNGFVKDGPILVASIDGGDGALFDVVAAPDYAGDGRT